MPNYRQLLLDVFDVKISIKLFSVIFQFTDLTNDNLDELIIGAPLWTRLPSIGGDYHNLSSLCSQVYTLILKNLILSVW